MRQHSVEAVGRRRAGRTAGRVVRAEHEVVDDQLRARLEKVREGARAADSIEAVFILQLDPGQLPPLLSQLVTEPGVLLLPSEQRSPRREPLFACSHLVINHRRLLSSERRGWFGTKERAGAAGVSARQLAPPRMPADVRRSFMRPPGVVTAGEFLRIRTR